MEGAVQQSIGRAGRRKGDEGHGRTGPAPDAVRPDRMLVDVSAETPRGTIFFQLFGPAATVDAQKAAYVAYVKGLK